MIPRRHIRNRGFTLIELMVAIALGLVLLTGVSAIFVNNNRSRIEIEKTAQQLENGRYAMQIVAGDLKEAGFLGLGYQPPTAVPTGALPDPCSADVAVLAAAKRLHVQGYNNVGTTLPTCLSDVKTGTDILVIRRAADCTSANPAETSCDAITTGVPYIQVSGCNADPAATAPDIVANKLTTDTSSMTLRKIGCTAASEVRRFRTDIYFIANNNKAGDGMPTLKRWELGTAGTGIVSLVEGIENLQFEYGIDTNSDGVPDDYTATPPAIADWWNVMAVRVGVLARNTEVSAGYTDNKTYSLPGGTTVGPVGDHVRRHAYVSLVRIVNPADRRQ